jgi:hypothetical protein
MRTTASDPDASSLDAPISPVRETDSVPGKKKGTGGAGTCGPCKSYMGGGILWEVQPFYNGHLEDIESDRRPVVMVTAGMAGWRGPPCHPELCGEKLQR